METHSRHQFTVPCSPAWIAIPTIKTLPHETGLAKPTCTTCHADEQKPYDNGVHGKALAAGNTKAANCESCHGNIHEILPSSDPKSRTARVNIPKTCGQCHSQPMPGMAGMPAVAYQESVHGRLVATGNDKSGGLLGLPRQPRHSPPQRSHFAGLPQPTFPRPAPSATAARRRFCQQHSRQGAGRGQYHAPVCTNCHGVHTIKAASDSTSHGVGQKPGRLCLRPVPQQREDDRGVSAFRAAARQL